MGHFSKSRMLTGSSILCQPIVNFASPSSPNLPLYPTLSKSAPSALPPRSPSSFSQQVHHVSQHPVVLDISRTPTPTIYCCEPEVAEIGASEYDVPFPYLNPHHHRRLHHSKSSDDESTSTVSLGALPPPLPIPVPLGIGSGSTMHDEEFTLAMDLPRAVGSGGGGGCNGGLGSPGKRWTKHPTSTAVSGRSLKMQPLLTCGWDT